MVCFFPAQKIVEKIKMMHMCTYITYMAFIINCGILVTHQLYKGINLIHGLISNVR